MTLAAVMLLVLTSGPLGQTSDKEPAGGPLPSEPSLAELASPDTKVGSKVRVTGKYKELIDQELILFDCSVPFILKSQEFSRQLLDLTPGRDNIIITGSVVQTDAAERAVEVEELTPGPSDFEIFSQEARTILKNGTNQAALLLRLAKRIVLFNKEHGDPQLIPLAHRIILEAYQARDESLPPDDAEKRFLFVREIHDSLAEKELTIKFLLDLVKKYPEHAGIKEFLVELNCRRYQGRWVTYDEFKRREGLVLLGDKWVTPAEKHMLEALEVFRRSATNILLLRKRTDREYRWLAESGKVETGMTREEVQAALGFADRVRRKLLQAKDFDQWSYGEKYYYFYDGVLVGFIP